MKQLKLSSLRAVLSGYKRLGRAVQKMPLTVFKEDVDYNITISPQYIRVNGEKYTINQLENMQRERADWMLPVLAQIEKKIHQAEYELSARNKRPRKMTVISPQEAQYAAEGREMISDLVIDEFDAWMNQGDYDDRVKKNVFYHDFGATQVNRATIQGFLDFFGVADVKELDYVFSEMYGTDTLQ